MPHPSARLRPTGSWAPGRLGIEAVRPGEGLRDRLPQDLGHVIAELELAERLGQGGVVPHGNAGLARGRDDPVGHEPDAGGGDAGRPLPGLVVERGGAAPGRRLGGSGGSGIDVERLAARGDVDRDRPPEGFGERVPELAGAVERALERITGRQRRG